MQTQNRLLDDLARLAGGAMGAAAGMREEVESQLRYQFERILSRMDLVTREEFEVVKAMAAKAREEQEVLADRVAALETELVAARSTGRRKTRASARKPKEGAKRSGAEVSET